MASGEARSSMCTCIVIREASLCCSISQQPAADTSPVNMVSAGSPCLSPSLDSRCDCRRGLGVGGGGGDGGGVETEGGWEEGEGDVVPSVLFNGSPY